MILELKLEGSSGLELLHRLILPDKSVKIPCSARTANLSTQHEHFGADK
jgi:hypothetical protein